MPTSYGYKSPANRRSTPCAELVSAVGATSWVLDLDVKAYFDSIDWELMLRAVRRHANRPWGAALHRALAEGSDADGGWQYRAANVGNASGRGHKPHPGKSVSALCVRHVDGEKGVLTSHRSSATRG